jgi:hypothetical protein
MKRIGRGLSGPAIEHLRHLYGGHHNLLARKHAPGISKKFTKWPSRPTVNCHTHGCLETASEALMIEIEELRATLNPWSTVMSNLTITVDGATLKKARLRALTEGISVNEVLRIFLESYAGVVPEQAAALDDLIDLSRRAKSRHGHDKPWSREELHERS